jgi:undecaprenyl-diphosphatase
MAAALVAACLALFVVIAEDVLDGGGLIGHDQAILGWFIDNRTPLLISAARLLSALGSFVTLAALGLLLGGCLWRRGWHAALVAAPVVSLTVAGIVSTLAKAWFGRPRPPVSLHQTTVTLAAFPSGHSTDAAAFFLAAAFTLAITVGRRRRTQVLLVLAALVLAALVGLSRLVLGVHWPSDVVAGWSLGTAIATSAVVLLWAQAAHASTRRRSSEG